MFAFGVCIGNESTYVSYAREAMTLVAGGDALIIEVRDQRSIHGAYNSILERVRGVPELEGLVLIHEDLQIRDARVLSKLRELFRDPSIAIVGAVGASAVTTLSWWLGEIRGAMSETRFRVERLNAAHEVESVDGSFIAMSPWAVENLTFDEERYVGFHGYDADICFAARSAGKRVVWEEFGLFHFTKGGYGDYASFLVNDVAFREKWILHDEGSLAPFDESARVHWRRSLDRENDRDLPRSVEDFGVRGSTVGSAEGVLERLREWGDGTVVNLTSFEEMAGVPDGPRRIAVLEECLRVLTPGGSLELRVPLILDSQGSRWRNGMTEWAPESFRRLVLENDDRRPRGSWTWGLASLGAIDDDTMRVVLVKRDGSW